MNETVLEQRELMIKLQAYDKKIIELEKILGEVDDQVSILEKNYEEGEKKVSGLVDTLAQKKKMYRMYEADVEANGQRLVKYEEHLKKLSSPKDYRALQREIDETRKLNNEIQESMLSLLEETEELEANVEKEKSLLEQLRIKFESDKEDIIKKAQSEANEKKELEAFKEDISKNLDSKVKDIYYDTLKKSSGVAIVPITNGVCNGCFLTIPPQVQIEIKRGNELIFCPRCHRIVYLEEDRPI